MFKLSIQELQYAYEAIEHHGFSALFPEPPEWTDIIRSWTDIRQLLSEEDLDTYRPIKALKAFAPKSRYSVRVVTHLHPQDLTIYTALVLIICADIERSRLPLDKNRVFSYRSDNSAPNRLYQGKDSFAAYKRELSQRSSRATCKYVAVADIADFYPRIYQHRLENAVATVASTTRSEEVARVLVKKFIFHIAEDASYGIPVGPHASRVLAEALMIDVDDSLSAERLDFVRWVDDFAFFCESEAEAQHSLFFLARWLFEKHGLTLNGAKTKVLSTSVFRESYISTHQERLVARRTTLRTIMAHPSDDGDDPLTEEQVAELDQINFVEMLGDALHDKDAVDYDLISFLLGRLSISGHFQDEWRLSLVDQVIDNIEHLYPVADSVARFFTSFTILTDATRVKIADALLKPVLSNEKFPPPDYYVMWALSIFSSHRGWQSADNVFSIFKKTNSEVIRRYAALALATTGNRSHALAVRDFYDQSSPLVKLAILRTCRLLANDELRFWKRQVMITGHVEKRI